MHSVTDQDHIICLFMGAPWGTIPVIALSEMLQVVLSDIDKTIAWIRVDDLPQRGKIIDCKMTFTKTFFVWVPTVKLHRTFFWLGPNMPRVTCCGTTRMQKFYFSWQWWGASHQHCKSKKEPPLFLFGPLRLYPSYTANAAIRNEGGAFSLLQRCCKTRDCLALTSFILNGKSQGLFNL